MQESEGLDPLGVIARAWRLLAVCAFIGAIVVVGGVSQLAKSYTSSARLKIIVDTTGNEDPARQVSTQLGLVTSDDVVNQVATLLHTSAFEVRRHVTATADTTADLITISAKASSSAAAQQLAQTVTTTFVDVSRSQGLAAKQAQLNAQNQVVASLKQQLTTLSTGSATLPGAQQAYADAVQQQQTLSGEVSTFTSPASVVTNADTPSAPSGLGTKKAGVLGLMLGLIAGGVIAFVRAGRAASGGPMGKLVAATGVPVIASLPTLTDLSGSDRRPSEAALDGGRAAAAALSPAGNRTVLITGTGGPDQRPLVARLIAEAAAAAGRRTTLVDADLRRPARGNAPGLAGLLRAQNRLSTDMVRMAAGATNVNNLSELRSGPDPAMALDLLRGPALPPILAALHLDSELVLIDGPSLDSPEVRAVAEAAGDVVVVVTSLSKPDEVEAGIAILRASGANVVGLIELAAHRRLIPTTLTRPNRAGAISAAAPEDAPAPTPTPTPAPGAPRTERTSDRIEPVRDPEPADEPAGPSTPQVSLLPAPPESRPPAFTAGTPDEPASWQPAANGWVPHVDETGDPRPSVTSADRDTD